MSQPLQLLNDGYVGDTFRFFKAMRLHTYAIFLFLSLNLKEMWQDGGSCKASGQFGTEAGGRWTQEPVRPVPLEAEWGEEWGVRRAAWRQPFIRASYVMCQHLSAFSERLNSAVRPLRSPLPTPALPSLLSAHARTRRLPVFRQAGERQRCAVEWSVQSDPGCYVIVGSVTMDTAEMCGGVERGGEGGKGVGRWGKGRPGAQQRLDTWIIHDASHQPTRSEPKWCSGLTGHVQIFQWERKVKLN